MGEYAVLEGAPALVAAVNRFANVEIRAEKESPSTVNSPTLNISNLKFDITNSGKLKFLNPISRELKKKLVFFTKTLEYFFRDQPVSDYSRPFRISLDTDNFFSKKGGQKLGLGSSAALTVALIHSLSAFFSDKNSINITTHQLFCNSRKAHQFAQGKQGSGIDVAASTYGGVLKFKISKVNQNNYPKISQIIIPSDLYIIPIWCQKSTSTRKFVRKVFSFKREEPKKYWPIMERLIELSTSGCNFIENGNTSAFFTVCDQYYHQLNQLGIASGVNIISEVHEKIGSIVKSAGAVYKPSGAGGGDIGIAYTNSHSIAQKVYEEVLHYGFEILNLSISKSESQVQVE